MSIVGDYDNGQFDDYYEICDRVYITGLYPVPDPGKKG